MASTATGLLGKNGMSQLKGAFTVPQPTKSESNKTDTSLFSIRNLMLLFSIVVIIKQLEISVRKTPSTTNNPYNIAVIGYFILLFKNQIK